MSQNLFAHTKTDYDATSDRLSVTGRPVSEVFEQLPYDASPVSKMGMDYTPKPKDHQLVFLVNDAQTGRREIAPGAGEVQVCTGHLFSRDDFGQRVETPVFKTYRF